MSNRRREKRATNPARQVARFALQLTRNTVIPAFKRGCGAGRDLEIAPPAPGTEFPAHGQRGVTFIELVISIVVIGTAVAGLLAVFSHTVGRSADPMLQEQAVAIAEAYLEEITLKGFLDPDTGTVCPAPEPSRPQFDNVCDYNGLSDNGARDQIGGAPIAGLAQYNVRVAVSNTDTTLNGVPAAQTLRVDVRVTHAASSLVDVRLSGYRTNY